MVPHAAVAHAFLFPHGPCGPRLLPNSAYPWLGFFIRSYDEALSACPLDPRSKPDDWGELPHEGLANVMPLGFDRFLGDVSRFCKILLVFSQC